MPLTDTMLRNLKPDGTPSKLADSEGLYLIAVRLRSNKKVRNLSEMWYKEFTKQLATQGDFGLEPPYRSLRPDAIVDSRTCFSEA